MSEHRFTEEHYEIVIQIGAERHAVPARMNLVEGVPWTLDYGAPGKGNSTSGTPPFNDAEHALTRAALNELNRALDISQGGATWGLPRRPLKIGETVTIQIRKAP